MVSFTRASLAQAFCLEQFALISDAYTRNASVHISVNWCLSVYITRGSGSHRFQFTPVPVQPSSNWFQFNPVLVQTSSGSIRFRFTGSIRFMEIMKNDFPMNSMNKVSEVCQFVFFCSIISPSGNNEKNNFPMSSMKQKYQKCFKKK